MTQCSHIWGVYAYQMQAASIYCVTLSEGERHLPRTSFYHSKQITPATYSSASERKLMTIFRSPIDSWAAGIVIYISSPRYLPDIWELFSRLEIYKMFTAPRQWCAMPLYYFDIAVDGPGNSRNPMRVSWTLCLTSDHWFDVDDVDIFLK